MASYNNDLLLMPTIVPYFYSVKLFNGHGLNNIVYMNYNSNQIIYNNSNNNITHQDIYLINHLNYIESIQILNKYNQNNNTIIHNSLIDNNNYINKNNRNNNIENFKDKEYLKIDENNKNENINILQTSHSSIESTSVFNSSPLTPISPYIKECTHQLIIENKSNDTNLPKIQLSTIKKKKNRPICKGIFLNGKNCSYASQLGKLYCITHDPDRQCQAYIGGNRCSKSTIEIESKYCNHHVNARPN